MSYEKKIFDEFPNYSIDTLGVFRNERNGKILKVAKTNTGYCYVALSNKICKKRVFSHFAVAFMFLNYFKGCHIHHKDGNKENNNIMNLECLIPYQHRKISFELGHNKMIDKPIDQYTKDGVFVKSYNSIMEAFRETNIDFRYISACLSGKQKSAYGFLFVNKGYVPNNYNKELSGRKRYKVYKYTKNGVLVKEYNSLHEAYLDSNVSKSKICSSINNKTNCRGDYFWSKKEFNSINTLNLA